MTGYELPPEVWWEVCWEGPVVLCDHHGWGGITAWQALGLLCETAAGWGLSQHSNSHAGITMAAMIHLAASVPQLTFASDTH